MVGEQPIDDYRLPRIDDLDSLQRFDEVDAILEKAKRDGAISLLPDSEEGVRQKDLHESRVRTIRTRLYLLGYLQRDSRSSAIGPKLETAIGHFQRDANLTQDGWVGEKTWTALQQLVSFEDPSEIADWFKDQSARTALMRAIRLRLFVLGFMPTKQAKGDQVLTQALERFVLVAEALSLHDTPLIPGADPETIKVLFDQDLMVERLAQPGDRFTVRRPEAVSQQTAGQAARKFIVCCAKVELWLLGYDIALDGKARSELPPSRMRKISSARYPLYHHLNTFWRENGQPKKNARKLASRVSPGFFRALHQSRRTSETSLDAGYSDRLYEVLAEEDDSVIEEVWSHIKAIGSRIWDGIRRVWGWFASFIKKTVKRAVTWVKNIARLAYRYAVNLFPVVHHALQIARESASFLVHRTFPGSDMNHIVINRDRDFDFRVYVNPSHSEKKTVSILQEFINRAQHFNIGARILGLLTGALVTVAKGIAVAGGWFGLILALVKVYSRVKEFREGLAEESAFLAIV